MHTTRIRIVLTLALALGVGAGSSTCLLAMPVNGPPALSLARPSGSLQSTAFATTALSLAKGVTYYIRPDGGSADQCTGLAHAPYPGSGAGQPCAWDHPFRALPPGGTPRIAGGDTLIVASGSYTVGLGAPGADNPDVCYPDGAYECHMPPIPSGTNPAHPTRILGADWDTGCSDPPELWGTQRPWFVVNLTDANNVEIACLEITDHSDCVEDHAHGVGGSTLTCERDAYPYGDWAAVGLYAEDSANVRLADLNIHGLASAGVHAGRLTDWTVEDVRIAGNGWVGWDGDIEGDDSNSGLLMFRHWTVEWNGCGETYPGGEPIGCWGQTAGGYGDGVGTGPTGGNWIIEDSAFLHNTSDGLDLLYAREMGSSITIRRTIAEGNAGDQIKTTGPTYVENVIAVSNCGFFEGKPFTFDVDNCRAGGSAIALTLRPGNQATVINSTITGQGDCLVITECADEDCDGSESVLLRNSIFQGNPEFGQSGDRTCLTWYGTAHDPFTIDYSIVNGVKGTPDPCPANNLCDVPPGLVDLGVDTFDAHPFSSSPAIDAAASSGAPSDDFDGYPRTAIPDIGAFEVSILKATPPGRVIDPGGVATYTISVRSVGGSTATIGLAATSPSPSLTLGLSPTEVTPPGQAILAIADSHVGTTLLPGLWYHIPVTGTNIITHTIHVSLLVGGVRIYLPVVLRGWTISQSRAQAPPQLAGCDVFPADNIWNAPVDTPPVDADSATYVATIGPGAYVHADFGSGTWEGGPIGIPYVDVPATQPRVPVTFDYDDESDPGPYPIPADPPIEGGPDSDGDRHILVLDRDNCVLYELFDAWPQPGGSWEAGSGAKFDLNSHALRPDTWTSADAAGLPILPGLVRYDEMAAGEIRHALRFTAPQTRGEHVWPARHDASSLTGTEYPPMGQRFRLRADFDVSGFSPEVQVILRALKKYGMMLADNGSAWFISGVPDGRWNNAALHELHQVHGSDVEAVDVSSLMVHPDLGQARRD